MDKADIASAKEQPVKSDPKDSSNNEVDPKLSNKREASWPSVLFYIHLNILGLYGIIVLFTQTKLITIIFSKLNRL